MLLSVAVHVLALAILVRLGGKHGLRVSLMVLTAVRRVTPWRMASKPLARAGTA